MQRSLSLIEPSRDPLLAYAALHNQIWILCDLGHFREAETQLFQLRPLQPHMGGRVNQVKFRWAEGRIDAGLDRLERAAKVLLDVRDGMTAIGRFYDAALVSLDLGAVLMGQRRYDHAAEVVFEAYQTFLALSIDREALASLVVLRRAFVTGIATRAMVERVAAELRKLESDPEAKLKV